MKIYLAGGTKTNWQGDVKKLVPNHTYLCPTELETPHQNASFKWTGVEYTMVKECDLVLAYFEKTNPSGIGMSIEIGWATAFGVPVILVDDHLQLNAMLCACSQRIYSSLTPAIEYLKGVK